jgi:glucans biosynthesis protein C
MKSSPSTQESLGERRYDLDWVRIGAFVLLILYHVGMYYVTWNWHVKSPHATSAIEPLMLITSPWRLAVLFLISGVATAYLMELKPRGFLGARSVRLLVPLVFGMAVIVPPQSYLEVVEKVRYGGSYLDFLKLYFTAYHGFCRGSDCLILPTYNHLWFVAYLWVYTLALYGAVHVLPGLIPLLRRAAERGLSGAGVLLWPILYLVLARYGLAHRFPQTNALVGDWYNHAVYGGVFLAGFALAGTRAPWVSMERVRWVALALAVLGWAFISAWVADSRTPSLAMLLVAGAVYGALQWLAIVAVLGFAHRHLRQDSEVRRYLTTAIFPVYILHQTVIVVCAHALKPVDLHPAIEALLLVLVTASTCFLGYEVIRRVALLRPLFGLALVTERARKPAAVACLQA